MEKKYIWPVIKYFIKKAIKAKEINADLQNILGNSAPSYSTVAKWTTKFKFGWESLNDDRCSGWLKSATTQKILQQGLLQR